jgi:hypothetical protein
MFVPMTGKQQKAAVRSPALLLEAWTSAGSGFSRAATRPEPSQRVGEGCPGWSGTLTWLKPGSMGGSVSKKSPQVGGCGCRLGAPI